MRSLILALFIFGLVPFMLTRPYVGLLVWSWIGYMNPHRLTYGFAFSFPWVQLVALVTFVAIVISKENKKIWPSPTVALIALFFLWTTVTTFFAAQPDAAWHSWDKFGKILIMVAVTFMLVKDQRRLHLLTWVIALSIGFYGIKGGLFTLATGGSYHVLGPPSSFIGDNNGLAQALCMAVPLWRYLQMQAEQKYLRMGLGFAMFLTCIAIFGTYSRGGFIGLAVVVLALVMKGRRRFVTITIFVVLAIVGYQFMPAKWVGRMATIQNTDSVTTVQTRIQSWEFAANVALANPLLGGGYKVSQSSFMWDRYGPEGAKKRAIHSIYFRVLGEHGFPGLILFVLLLYISWRNCAQVRRRTRGVPEQKWAFDLASMLQVCLLAFMIEGAANTLSYFDLVYQLMAICALLNGVIMMSNKNDERPSRLATNTP